MFNITPCHVSLIPIHSEDNKMEVFGSAECIIYLYFMVLKQTNVMGYSPWQFLSFYGFPLLSYVVCFSLGLSLFEPYFSGAAWCGS